MECTDESGLKKAVVEYDSGKSVPDGNAGEFIA